MNLQAILCLLLGILYPGAAQRPDAGAGRRDPCREKSRLAAHPDYCDRYFECSGGQAYEVDCPNGLVFTGPGALLENCDYPNEKPHACVDKQLANPPIATEHCDWLYGIFAHETSCTRYWTCWNGTATEQFCIGGLLYKEETHACDWPQFVSGCQKHPLCVENANGNVPLGKSCERYWSCQGGYPRLMRCPASLVFDRRTRRCVHAPTEDCAAPPTEATLSPQTRLQRRRGGAGRAVRPPTPGRRTARRQEAAAPSLGQTQEASSRSVQALEPRQETSSRSVQTLEPVQEATSRSHETLGPVQEASSRSAQTVEPVQEASSLSAQTVEPVQEASSRSAQTLEQVQEASSRSAQILQPALEASSLSAQNLVQAQEAASNFADTVEAAHKVPSRSVRPLVLTPEAADLATHPPVQAQDVASRSAQPRVSDEQAADRSSQPPAAAQEVIGRFFRPPIPTKVANGRSVQLPVPGQDGNAFSAGPLELVLPGPASRNEVILAEPQEQGQGQGQAHQDQRQRDIQQDQQLGQTQESQEQGRAQFTAPVGFVPAI